MADLKISQLTAVSTPLAGTEVLPIVQSGATKKVTALELTGTTVDSFGNVAIANGNLVIGTSGKGIDFSATSGAGTSELLNDYEEGTWTPTIFGSGTAGTYTVSAVARYTKVGRLVTVTARITFSAASGGAGSMNIGGLPFNYASGAAGDLGMVAAANLDLVNASPASLSIVRNGSGSDSVVNIAETVDNGSGSLVQINNVSTSTAITFTFIYNA